MKILIPLFFLFFEQAFGQERITLRITDWAGPDEMKLDMEAIAEFEKRYPHIKVLYEPNPGRQYEAKILTALAAGEPPDVFLLDSKLIPSFVNKGVLLDLTAYIEKLKIDTSQWYRSVLNIARKDSKLYAFPKGFTPLVIYYNKRLFDSAGVPYPEPDWTWDDYLEISKKLTRDIDRDGVPEQYGTVFLNYYFYWIPWVWSAGGDVISPDGTKSTGFLNSKQTKEALQFLIDLRKRYKVAPEIGSWAQAGRTGLVYALFIDNKIAMMIDGHWRLPQLLKHMENGKIDIGVAPLPKHPDGGKVNVMYESGWCVPISTKHPEEAVLLAAFMAGETSARIRSKRKLEILSVISVAQEIVRNDTTGMEEIFLKEIPYCRQPWGSIIERFTEIEWILQDAIDEVMLKNRPMHETMIEYAKRIDRELERIRKHSTYRFKPIREHTEILKFLIGTIVAVFMLCLILYISSKGRERKAMGTAFVFLAPSLLHLAIFTFTPIIFAGYLSVHRWDIVVPDKPYVGAGNFIEMLSDPAFWNALKNTFIYSLNVPVGMMFSLLIALLLHRRIKGINLFRTLYFLPSVTSLVAVSLVWIWIYHPRFGIANFFLNLLGLPSIQWLNSTQTAMISIIIFSIWLGIGYQMVIFLAGLRGIPDEFYEIALIDGANAWQRFKYVTLPLLKPVTFFILVTSFIASFQVFTPIYIMTSGGPVRSTDVIVYHIYQSAWEHLRMGYASAMSWFLFVIIVIATWIQFKLIGKGFEL